MEMGEDPLFDVIVGKGVGEVKGFFTLPPFLLASASIIMPPKKRTAKAKIDSFLKI
jgi:hypothetical protein